MIVIFLLSSGSYDRYLAVIIWFVCCRIGKLILCFVMAVTGMYQWGGVSVSHLTQRPRWGLSDSPGSIPGIYVNVICISHPANFYEFDRPVLGALLRNMKNHSTLITLWFSLETVQYIIISSYNIEVSTHLKALPFSNTTIWDISFGLNKWTNFTFATVLKIYLFSRVLSKNWTCFPCCISSLCGPLFLVWPLGTTHT